MYGYNEGPKFNAGELGEVSETFLFAFRKKCKEKFGTESGISSILNGQPPRVRIQKSEANGKLSSVETWEAVKGIATEILNTYDLDTANLEVKFDTDSYDEPTIIIQYKED